MTKQSADLGSYGPDSQNAPNYQAGQPWGICDRCAEKHRLRAMKREWTGLTVCSRCWDPKPPDMTPPNVWPEGVGIPNAKPEPPNIFVQVNMPGYD